MRRRGQEDRHVQLGRQPLQSGNMVGVLVGNQDRGNFLHALAERARSRLKVSRPDRPASTRMRVALVATSAQFPRLPLASTDTDTAISRSLRPAAVETGTVFRRPVPLAER